MKIKRNELLLFLGRWTSKIGDIVFDYVNSVMIVSAFSNSTWVLALYQSSQTLINILFNLIGGAIADLGQRKRIIILTDLASALICFVTSFFLDSDHIATILIISNALLAFVFSFSSPTFKSIVKEMIEKERIGFYNSISNTGSDLIKLVGPVIGLSLMSAVGARGALLINALTFALSAGSEMLLVPIAHNSNTIKPKVKRSNIIQHIIEGIKYLWKEKTIFHLVLLSALVNFFLSGYNLLVPYTDIMYHDTFRGFYSKVLVMGALGGLIGSFINSKLSPQIAQSRTTLVVLLGLTGIPLVILPLLSLTANIILCILPFFAFSVFLTMFNINFMTYVHIYVDEDYLGRVFSVIFTVAVMFMPIGSFVFSVVLNTSNVIGFSVVGTGIMVLTFLSAKIICRNN